MVWDPPKKPVNVNRMVLYGIIPILNIYAEWRIQKFWAIEGIGLAIGAVEELITMSLGLNELSNEIFNFIIELVTNIIITVYLVRYFAKRYNEKISSIQPSV